METLPLELLQTISEHLGDCEPRRRSLLAFALTSKTCRDAASRERFSRISLEIRGPKQLRHELRRVEEVLVVGNRKRHVRKLKISGSIPLSSWNQKGEEIEEATSVSSALDKAAQDGDEDCANPFADLPTSRPAIRGPPVPMPREAELRRQTAWGPLSLFVSTLALTDLIWASANPVPPSVLSALHGLKSWCRLHVHTFYLPSLYYPIDEAYRVDNHDLALAASPCLYSVMYLTRKWYTPGRIDYNEDALLQMASGLAPNLCNLRIQVHKSRVDGRPQSLRAWRAPARPWHGFHPTGTSADSALHTGRKGQLKSLQIRGSFCVTSAQLNLWEANVEFSHLQNLSLLIGHRLDTLHRLVELADNGAFTSLRNLAITGWYDCEDERNGEKKEWDETMARFLPALLPLEEVSLGRFTGEASISAIARFHATALHRQ